MSMVRSKPFFIFDRDGAGHAWEQPLRELLDGSDERRRAVVENWQMDHRVSDKRETEDLLGSGCFTAGGKAEEWFSSLFRYRKLRLCLPSDTATDPRSAYLGAWNDSNRVHGIAPFDRLCHVGSLKMITKRVLEGSTTADAAAELRAKTSVVLPEKPPGETDPAWLAQAVDQFARNLTARGGAAVRVAARILLEALGSNEPPWWACFSGDLSKVEAGSAVGLCKALGLGHFESRDWLVVWNYEVRVAGPLYRPTVAEATDCPFHYPSPPGIPFGLIMPLDPDLENRREVLHRPLRGAAAETACTGKLLPLENFPPMEDTQLKELRGLHRDKLRAWHDRHIAL